MVRIYALKNGEEVLYVGKTGGTLDWRSACHRSSSNSAGSKHIPSGVKWEIALLEECEEGIATARERHYVETLKPPYNKRIPGRTRVETQKAYRQSDAGKAAKKRCKERKRAALLQENGE